MSCWETVVVEFAVPGGLTLSRQGQATYAYGLSTRPSATTIALDPVALMPMSGRDMQLLPEGARVDEWVKMYCLDELRTADVDGGNQADRFTYNGQTFEVKTAQPWNLLDTDARYYKYLAQRVVNG